jgi:hypothetical protein
VYVIRFFIERLALSPVAGTDDPYLLPTNSESNRQDSSSNLSEREIATFGSAVFEIFRQYDLGIVEDHCRQIERDAVLCSIVPRLRFIQLEPHGGMVIEAP